MSLLNYIKKIIELYDVMLKAGQHYMDSTNMEDLEYCHAINMLMSDLHNVNKSLLIYWHKVVDLVIKLNEAVPQKKLPEDQLRKSIATTHEALQKITKERDKKLILLDKAIREGLLPEEDFYSAFRKKYHDKGVENIKKVKSDALNILETIIDY